MEQMRDIGPVCVKDLGSRGIGFRLLDGLFVHGQILTDSVARDLELSSNSSDG